MAKRWNEKFRCFQGRCVTVDHLQMDDQEIERLFMGLFPQEEACCDRYWRDGDFDPADYEIDEKREMVEEFINEDGDWVYDSINEAHDETREDWLDMCCLCKDRALQPPTLRTFLPFQEVNRPKTSFDYELFADDDLTDPQVALWIGSYIPS
ncbi:hypothetical protein E8E12_011315 [Didymella heteroderae]|uniref:Uncharacterized protein n=1 Tax=Didymella heteroderae TaxID=1769908 RepID=A0A9P4WZI2_9PLEO|nr:hypothetical protein E8E12_011315 [Didymella heteroderae]